MMRSHSFAGIFDLGIACMALQSLVYRLALAEFSRVLWNSAPSSMHVSSRGSCRIGVALAVLVCPGCQSNKDPSELAQALRARGPPTARINGLGERHARFASSLEEGL